MSIQNLILGNLVSRGADRLLNPNKKNVVDINKFISGGGIGGEEEKDKVTRNLGAQAQELSFIFCFGRFGGYCILPPWPDRENQFTHPHD